ncbi:MAG: hypothetical protein DRJ03_07640 [Chloroflexi bacterium]|nr:MAG: hypothetical protein DRJ03_07640 [Chloroflexota bacterium]
MDYSTIDKLLPETLKTALDAHQSHRLFSARTGIQDLTLAKIAAYLGAKTAERKAKWRPVFDGIQALENLRRGQ